MKGLKTFHRLGRLIQEHQRQLQDLRDGELADWLYAHWYMLPEAMFEQRSMRWPLPAVGAVLRAALQTPEHWSSGWVALEIGANQRVLAGRGVERRLLDIGDHANLSRPGVPVQPGDALATFNLLTWTDVFTGWQGLRPHASEPVGPLRRVYFSVDLEHLPAVAQTLVAVLQASGFAWTLKCPLEPIGYARVDTLVVYLEDAQWLQAKPAVAALARQLAPRLRAVVPPLTQRVGRGVAVADDPQGSQSFGQSRCVALADGAQRWLARPSTELALRRQLMAALRRAGIDPAQPWRCWSDVARAVVPHA